MKVWIILLLLSIGVCVLLTSFKKAITVAAGFGIYTFCMDLYDKILWPVVQGRYGLNGALAMSAGAMMMNFTLLVIYQKCHIDWLGVSLVDDLRMRTDQIHGSLTRGTIASLLLRPPLMAIQGAVWLLRTPWTAFLLLTLWEDSFVTTAFLRRGRFGSLQRRDLAIFAASTTLSCLTWSLFSGAIVASVTVLWRHFLSP